MNKLKEYAIIDIYGETYFYTTRNKKEAKECFIASNGKTAFNCFNEVV